MTIYVQGLSALAHYRTPDARTEVEHCSRKIRSLSNATSSLKEIMDAGIWRLGIGEPSAGHPLEVLVSDRNQRSGSRAVRPRVWSGSVATTSFRRVSDDIYVSSPEFVFLQMATRLDLPQLAALGMELCGTYRSHVPVPSIDTDTTAFTTVYQQEPLSTPRRLRGFLMSMKRAPGQPRALKALEYVMPGSASPMESVIYLLLCLPRRLGGYALPNPVLNPPIVFSKSGRRYTLRRSARPDLYWRPFRLDLEYNSDEFHDENQRAIDSMRRKALEHMKVEVIELTHDELYSTSLFHATALRIADRLGKRIRPEQEGNFIEKRAALRKQLLFEECDAPSDQPGTSQRSVAALLDGDSATDAAEIWLEEGSDNMVWFEGPFDADGSWAVDTIDWNDNTLYVFGAGKRRAK